MKTEMPRDDLIRMVEMSPAHVEFRASDDELDGILGTLHGYAAMFNAPTEINSWEGHFTERIMPGAFKHTLERDGSKIKVLFNHGFDPSIGDKPLGKPRVMREDDKGLYVEVPLDDTSYNRDIVASLRSGALDGQSFRFSVVREEWDESSGIPARTIKQCRLYEFGPVTFPAYEATTAGVRAREAYTAWRTARTIGSERGPELSIDSRDPAVSDPGTADEQPDTSPIPASVGRNQKQRRYLADRAIKKLSQHDAA